MATKKQSEAMDLHLEIREKELEYFKLDEKDDRTNAENVQHGHLDNVIKELREKEITLLKEVQAEQIAAVVEVNATEGPEAREKRELRSKVSFGGFITQRFNGHDAWTSEYAEFASAVGATPNEIPTALFEREVRALTDAPSKASQTVEAVSTVSPAIEYAFNPVAAASLGVVLRPVGPGESHHVTVTTPPPSSAKSKGDALANTAAVLSLEPRKPVRLGSQFEVAVEDLALYPALDSDLDRSAAAAIADRTDIEILSGSGTSPHLTGLFSTATDVAVDGTLETFGSGVKRFGGLVDGLHAQAWSDVRAIIGSDTFTAYVGTLADSTSVNLYDYLKERLGSLMVSNRVPATSSDGQKVLATLMGRGEPIVINVWPSMPMRIDDDLSAAGSGKRIITLYTLVSDPFIPYGAAQVKELHPKIS